MSMSIPPAIQAYVAQLHSLTDQLLAPVSAAHAGRLQCRVGCASCCVDDITVFEVEADRILRALEGQALRPGPTGACALLDSDGACRVYAVRPYVCRTQGLPLRWGEDGPEGPVERRDICPLNDGDPAIESLPAEVCWTLGPVEERLAGAQRAAQKAQGESDDAELRRVSLRSLLPVPADG